MFGPKVLKRYGLNHNTNEVQPEAKQEVLGRINRPLSFDMTWTAQ
jgi:hypothetical protein